MKDKHHTIVKEKSSEIHADIKNVLRKHGLSNARFHMTFIDANSGGCVWKCHRVWDPRTQTYKTVCKCV